MACPLDQLVDQLERWWIALHQRDVAEERDRVVMEDPVVLAADKRGHGRRRDPLEDGRAVEAQQIEIAEQCLVVAELLVDVLLQVARERRGERIIQLARPGERRLGQRHSSADDLMLEDQVLRPELAEARVRDERLVGTREGNDEQAELAAQTGARSVRLRVGQWTALTLRSGERFGSFVSSPPSS